MNVPSSKCVLLELLTLHVNESSPYESPYAIFDEFSAVVKFPEVQT